VLKQRFFLVSNVLIAIDKMIGLQRLHLLFHVLAGLAKELLLLGLELGPVRSRRFVEEKVGFFHGDVLTLKEESNAAGKGLRMEQNPFEKSIDQTRLDRLRGGILAFVSDFEQQGYDDFEVARALVWVAYRRVRRAPQPLYEHFLQFVRNTAQEALDDGSALVRSFTKENEKNKIN
jgi:hypothetical protein